MTDLLERMAAAAAPKLMPAPSEPGLVLDAVSAWYGGFQAVADVSLQIPAHRVTAFIGPSGCGKTTLLRCLNRLHETTPGARVTGAVRLGGKDIYAPHTDPVAVRTRIGMVFQRATPFPTMSIRENVLAGARLQGRRLSRADADALVETSLRDAGLWDEVRDRLGRAGTDLSGGQQQRLCIARVLAVHPQVILMDEPCSALDPISTAAVERLIMALRDSYTVVVVTHNMQQAARISDVTAFFSLDATGRPGRLVECGPTEQIFHHPMDAATADYVAGRFG